MLVFGSYLIIVGGVVMGFFPHHILTILDLKVDNDTFVRMTGLLAAILGVNYLLMVRETTVICFKFSIIMRYLAALFMFSMVITGISPQNLLLLAFGDAMAATWTLVALRKDQQENQSKQKNLNKKN
ncbi:unnamed protein product [Rotaria sordida]|uniref:Uncharacterized protein n=1 Tax=Rotaria sordida TaxID=392033 RepID=A0A818QBN6_9BILA|nr:unnamed protein product [Rotaria sordida]CAF3636793.1 unnamed protein product [Rotaria sordida]